MNIKLWTTGLLAFLLGYQADNISHYLIDYSIEKKFGLEQETPSEIIKTRLFNINSNTVSKKAVPCPEKQEVYVVAGFGQSNSTNSGGHRFNIDNESILNFYEGKCYVASDPLLGTTGQRGAIWIPFAQELRLSKKILLVTFGIDGSKVDSWLSEDHLAPHLRKNLDSLKSSGYPPDLFVWFQGESDKNTNPSRYSKDLEQLLKNIHAEFPGSRISLSSTSYCGGGSKHAITDAQKLIASRNNYIWLGNTDILNAPEYRYDNCHLSEQGLRSVAGMFAKSVRN